MNRQNYLNYKENTMNRRTFLKSTALSLLPPTLLLKGKEPLKPLQWTSFSQKLPKKKELIIVAEKYIPNSAHFLDPHIDIKLGYAIGARCEDNSIYVGGTFCNKKTGKKEYYQSIGIDMQQKPYKHQIFINSQYWIKVKDVIKHMKKTPTNQLKIGMDIMSIKQTGTKQIQLAKMPTYAIYVGKIKNINQEIQIENRYFFNKMIMDEVILYQTFINKDINMQWTELPQL